MKTHLYLLFILILTACQIKNNECKESQKFLNEFNKGFSEKYPPLNSNLSMFFKLDDNSIIELNNIKLYDIYRREYKDKFKFSVFLCYLFNEKIYLKRDFFNQNHLIIKPDNDIISLKENELIDKYCIKEFNYWILKNGLKNEENKTVLYTFFRNKKYISFDDYQGYYIILDSLR